MDADAGEAAVQRAGLVLPPPASPAEEGTSGAGQKTACDFGFFGDPAAVSQAPHDFGWLTCVAGGWLVLQDEGTHVLGSVASSGPCCTDDSLPPRPPPPTHILLMY